MNTGVLLLLGRGVGVEKSYSLLQLPGTVNRDIVFSKAGQANLCQACCEPVTIIRQLLVVCGPDPSSRVPSVQSPHFKLDGVAKGLCRE